MTMMTTIQTPLFGAEAHDAMVQQVANEWKIPLRGFADAPVIVLCEPPSIEAARQSLPMDMSLLKLWAREAKRAGFVEADFLMVGLCPPIPKAAQGSERAKWEYVSQYIPAVQEVIEKHKPKLVVTIGATPGRVMAGRAVSVKNWRGMFHPSKMGMPFFQTLSLNLVSIQPDNRPIFEADLGILSRVKAGGWNPDVLGRIETDYRWADDLQFMLDSRPKIIAVDTETTGIDTQAEDFRVLTVQLTIKEGQTFVCRVCPDYFPDHFARLGQDRDTCARLRRQIKTLMEDPSIVKVFHNGKYDFKAMRSIGIELTEFWDTELMARFVNENFMQYNLDDMIRIYVPEMGGFNDRFNETVDKNRMIEVPPEDEIGPDGKVLRYGMRSYAGGDTDATFRLAKVLTPLMRQDPHNVHVFNRVHRRALFAMTKTMETFGFTIDEDALRAFQTELEEWVTQETQSLYRLAPAAVRRKYLTDPKGFKFSRDEVMRDVLFSKEGFGLKACVFTPGTMNNPDPSKRIPSVSTKDHMPYFLDAPGVAGQFVQRYIELKKAQKMLDTYARGFWKYIKPGVGGENKIVPQYNFRTNTKRSNSSDPNGQNFPKRGRFAKPFRRLFRASQGKVLVASDLSQAELRIAAWMANEPEMLRIYRDDGDIHASTAAMTMKIDDIAFAALDRAIKKAKRQNAKAVNFGYIYGAREQTFITYAKTNYNVDFSLREATEIREGYFQKFSALLPWHERMKAFAKEHGYVKSLHGLTRHLHAIYSTDWSIMSGAERNAINSPVQNFGSDLGIIAFLRLSAQADPNLIRPIGFIHDQLVAEVDENYVAEGMGWLKWVMENPPLEEWFGIRPPLPIKSDPEWGRILGDTTELADAPEMAERVAEHVRKPDWWVDDEEAVWAQYTANAQVPVHLIREAFFD